MFLVTFHHWLQKGPVKEEKENMSGAVFTALLFSVSSNLKLQMKHKENEIRRTWLQTNIADCKPHQEVVDIIRTWLTLGEVCKGPWLQKHSEFDEKYKFKKRTEQQ